MTSSGWRSEQIVITPERRLADRPEERAAGRATSPSAAARACAAPRARRERQRDREEATTRFANSTNAWWLGLREERAGLAARASLAAEPDAVSRTVAPLSDDQVERDAVASASAGTPRRQLDARGRATAHAESRRPAPM